MRTLLLALSLVVSSVGFAYDLRASSRPVDWGLECSSKDVFDAGYILHIKPQDKGFVASVDEDGMLGGPKLFGGAVSITPDSSLGKCRLIISDKTDDPGTIITFNPDGDANDIAVIEKLNGIDYRSKRFSTLSCLFANNFRNQLPKCSE